MRKNLLLSMIALSLLTGCQGQSSLESPDTTQKSESTEASSYKLGFSHIYQNETLEVSITNHSDQPLTYDTIDVQLMVYTNGQWTSPNGEQTGTSAFAMQSTILPGETAIDPRAVSANQLIKGETYRLSYRFSTTAVDSGEPYNAFYEFTF